MVVTDRGVYGKRGDEWIRFVPKNYLDEDWIMMLASAIGRVPTDLPGGDIQRTARIQVLLKEALGE